MRIALANSALWARFALLIISQGQHIMHTNLLRRFVLVMTVSLFTSLNASADIVEWFDDDWWNAVGDVTTIDFTGFENFEILSDQYAEFGITFSSASNGILHFLEGDGFLNDGWGFRGLNGAWLHFDKPMNWIAAVYSGFLGFELYSGDDLVFTSIEFGLGGTGNFAGLTSSAPFDSVFLWKQGGGPTQEFAIFVDDLHFGAIPAPGALGVFAIGFLGALSRHRRREN